MNNTSFLHAMFGGKNGGANLTSGAATGEYDFIIVESGVTLSVLASAAIARVDTVEVSGTSGTATILCDAVSKTLTVTDAATLTATLAAFVVTNAAAYAAGGVTLTSSGTRLIFTSATAGTDFTGNTTITNLTGNIQGNVIATTANYASVNLLTAKGLGSVAFTSERILSAGTGHKIMTPTFTGGLVWGYTVETSTI